MIQKSNPNFSLSNEKDLRKQKKNQRRAVQVTKGWVEGAAVWLLYEYFDSGLKR